MAKKEDLYDFNAPTYVDFMKDDLDEVDDSFFETRTKEQPDAVTEEPPTSSEPVPEPPASSEPVPEPLTSSETLQDPPTEATPEAEQPSTDHVESEEQQQMSRAVPGKVESGTRGKRNSLKLSSVGVRQSPRLSAIAKAIRRSSADRRSLGNATATSRTRDNKVQKVLPQKRVMVKMAGASGITQDDKKELETVATFQQKITNNKRKKDASGHNQPLRATKPQEFHFATDQRLRKHQVEDPAPAPAASVSRRNSRSGPTRPQEFSFATDARLKGKEHVKGEETEAPVDFMKSLRSSTTSLNKDSAAKKGPTIPQPFHLSDSRRPQAGESKRFVSIEELSCKHYFRTPKRNNVTEEHEHSKKPRGPTVAHTPNLATSRRRRSLSVMTHEEREQQAFEEAQKEAFKAHPVNRKVFQTPTTGYSVKKLTTTVSGPVLITDDSKKSKTPLLPEGFAEEMKDLPTIPLSCLPYAGLPLMGKRHTTKVQPFSFDSRDKAKLIKKQEKIKKVLEEEKSLAEFHAQPMPVFEDGVHGVPAKKPPTPTQVKPFALHADQRGAIKKEKFKQQLEDEARAEAEQRRFHAQDDHVVHKAPFIPEKSNRPLTEISNITLNTEVRAIDRSEFDQHLKMAEAEMLAAKKAAEERRAAEELAEVTRLRQEAVHKAQPMHKFKPMVIQPASQVPTVPQSPNFATETRLRSRSRANSTFNL